MTPPSTQNLKALGLWVFFFICCSTFSFLLNVGLRLTLGYLTNTRMSRSPTNLRLWYHLLGESEGETPGRSLTMRTEPNPYKRMTPPSTQNLKVLGLRVFFHICCSTFSFLPNVGLRLTLEYLTVHEVQRGQPRVKSNHGNWCQRIIDDHKLAPIFCQKYIFQMRG